MKKSLLIFLAVFIMMLSSCTETAINGELIGQNEDEFFEIKLYTNKGVYSSNEPIVCYAAVEYIGEGNSVTIYSADPLVYFTLKGGKYFDGDYMVSFVGISTQFKKGEPVTYEFQKSGGYSSDDPNAEFYKQFYSEKQLILPPGEYELSAVIDGIFDQNDYEGSKYSLSASVNIRVE